MCSRYLSFYQGPDSLAILYMMSSLTMTIFQLHNRTLLIMMSSPSSSSSSSSIYIHLYPSISIYFHLYPYIHLCSSNYETIQFSPSFVPQDGRRVHLFPAFRRRKLPGEDCAARYFGRVWNGGWMGLKETAQWGWKIPNDLEIWKIDFMTWHHNFWISHMPPLGFWGISSLMQWGDWWSSHRRAG